LETTVTNADLLATGFDVLTDHVPAGVTEIEFTVFNQGSEVARDFQVAFVYSEDEIIGNDDDLQVGTFAIAELGADEELTETREVTIPQERLFAQALEEDLPGQGLDYVSGNVGYLALVIDPSNQLGELDESNNSNRGQGVDLDNITYFPWDVNGSGRVTPTDVVYILNRLGEEGTLADLNGDGTVTGSDVILVRDRLGYTRNEAVFQDIPEVLTVEISPTDGEEMVNLTRETIVRFGGTVREETVTPESFYLIANGSRVQGEIRVSSTGEFATFFYEEPLPPSTEVRVVVEGDRILASNGTPIDGDGDGVAGGRATADFRTLPLTQIEGTNVFGYVFDSFNRDEEGENIPVVGATVRVDALPELVAVTDEDGFFRLENLPAPEFAVHVDGSTAINAPEGTVYATVGKIFESVPGTEVQLNHHGEVFDVYLPPMATEDIQQLNPDEDTEVGFGEAGLAQLAQSFPDVEPSVWELVEVTIPAGSAQDDEGNVATQATIIPVDPDRLPGPLPPGVAPQLVISIQAGGEEGFSQAGGATNFDVPAPVTFPNLDGLAPGEQSLIWSFNHDAGDWEVIGNGTVSEDGTRVVSDEGVGILAPGWHFTQPGTEPEEPPEEPPCPDFGWGDAWKLGKAGFDCIKNLTRAFQAVGAFADVIDNMSDLSKDIETLRKGYGDGTITIDEVKAAVGRIQKTKNSVVSVWEAATSVNPVSKAIDALKCANGIIQTANDLICKRKDCSGKVAEFICNKIQPILKLANKLVDKIDDLDKSIRKAPLTAVCLALDSFLTGLEVGSPLALSAEGITANNIDEPDPEILAAMDVVLEEIVTFEEEIQSAGELEQTLQETEIEMEDLQDNGLTRLLTQTKAYRNAYWRITVGEFESRGVTSASGELNLPVLAPETSYRLEIYDPEFNVLAVSEGLTAQSGQPTVIAPFQTQSLDDAVDGDGDQLVDLAEEVVGTSAINFDTDSDGISDFAEIQQGLDPLGDRGFPTGIISSLPLQGEANAVVVEGSTLNAQNQTAYVATGSHGLAIVDAGQFNNPIVLGQLDLAGDATDVAVDPNLQIVAVATNSGGLQLVDVSDPMLPTLTQTIDISVNQVEIVDGTAYATASTSLRAYDLLTGEELHNTTLPGSGTVTGLAREGTNLYAYTSGSDTFSIIDIADSLTSTVLGQLDVSVASSEVGVFAANGVAYLAGSGLQTIDITDPSNPTLISDADLFFTSRNVTLNGSGLALVAAEGQGMAIYDVSDPETTDAFVTVIDTPGFARDIAIASGIAYVADDNGDLQVINYLSFDSQGQPPTVTISTPSDIDTNTEGIQVLEGANIPIIADVEDDVQVRNVELLVNGEVLQNDLSFPFDLSAVAPNITPESNTIQIQVRATDTGGNSSLSNQLTIELVEDTFAPETVSTTPSEGDRRRNIPAISVRFNEAIDTERLDISGISLTNLGEDGVLGTDDDFAVTPEGLQTINFDRTLVILPPVDMPPGDYQLAIDPTIISDRAGNELTEAPTLQFTKRPLSIDVSLGETVAETIFLAGEDEIFTFNGTLGQRLFFDGLSDNSGFRSRLISPSGIELFNIDSTQNREPFSIIESGTYQLIVDGGFSNNTGDFSFRLLDLANVPTLALDTTIEDTIELIGESDIYQFQGIAEQRLYFDGLGSDFSASWELYGTANQFINSNSLNGDFEVSLPTDGTYILLVNNNFSPDPSVDYSFQIVTPETTTTALTLGETVTANIGEPGEIDIYTFDGTAGEGVYFDGLDENFTNINARLLSPSGESLFNWGTDSNSNPITLRETGTYQLIVNPSGETTGNYSFRLLDIAAETELELDTPITATLDPGLETDIYQFVGTAEQRLYFDSLASVSGADWYLYGPNNQFVNSNSLGFDFEVQLPGDGLYTLAIEGFSPDSTVDYSFQVVTPERTTAALTLGETITASIAEAGEEDIYTFSGTPGQRLYFDGLDDNNSSINAQLLTPSGNSLFNGSTNNNSDPLTLIETGIYQLIINPSSETTGDYSFRLLDIGAETELELDTTITATLDPGLATDIYQFVGTTEQRLYFDSLASVSGASWRLYGPNNQFINSDSLGFDFEVQLPGDGLYTLVLEGYTPSGTINYSFQVITSERNSTALTLGETVADSIDEPGEVDIYTFSGTAGQRLYFDGLDNNSNLSVQLWSPTGSNLSNFTTNRDGTPLPLIETGTYELIIDPSGDTTDDYSFRILDIAAATELTLESTIDGTLDPGIETHLYQFSATTGQRLFFDSLASSFSFDADWTLYRPDNRFLDGTNSSSDFEATIPGDGVYFLAIEGENSSGTTNYSFQVNDISDTPVEASGFGIVQSGEIDPGGEETFTFDAPAGLRVYFDSLNTNSNQLTYQLINPENQQVFFIDATSDRDTFTLPISGTYTLTVSGANSSETENYSFQFIDLAVNSTELTLHSVVTETLPAQTTQVYRFEATPGQRLYFDGLSNDNVRIRAELLSPSGNRLFDVDTGSNFSPLTIIEGGIYYLVVDGDQESETDYSFRLLDIGEATALELDSTIDGTLDPGLETDIYQFTGTAGQRLYLDSLASVSGSWAVWGPNNQIIRSNSLSSDLEIELPGDGIYALVIEAFASDGTVDYSFQVVTPTQTETPLTLGETIAGGIGEPGEVDIYTLSATAGQRLYFDGLDLETNIDIQLFSPSSNEILSSFFGSDSSPVTITETGTYQLILNPSGATTGEYSFRLLDLTQAPELTFDSLVEGTLDPGVETDVATAGERIYFDSTDTVSSVSWLVYGPGDRFIDSNYSLSDFEVTLPVDGLYTLLLEGSNSSGTTNYSFVAVTPETTSTALTLGETVTGAIEEPAEVDIYTFDVTAGSRLYFDGLGNNSSVEVQLLSPSGDRFFDIFNIFANNDSNPVTILETGTYQLIIDDSGSSTGEYSFRLLDLTQAPELTLDTTIEGTLDPGVETDIYQFVGTAGERLYFDSTDTVSNTSWRLYGPGEGLIESRFSLSDFEVTLPVEGLYTLILQGFNSSGTINYSFAAVTPETTSTALTLGETITGTIEEPAEVDIYTFNGTAGERLYFDGLGDNSSINAQLSSPSGISLFNRNSSSNSEPFTLIETGTYQLILNPSGNTTGEYSFRMLNIDNSPLLPLNTTTEGTLDPGIETDIYQLPANSGDTILFEDEGSTFFNAAWLLYGPGNQFIDSRSFGFDFEATLVGEGNYLLLVEGSNTSGTVNYSIRPVT